MKALISEEERAPQIIVLENVCGTLTSHEGKYFTVNYMHGDPQQTGLFRSAHLLLTPCSLSPSRARAFLSSASKTMLQIPDANASLKKYRSPPWHTRIKLPFTTSFSEDAKDRLDMVEPPPMPPKRTIEFSQTSSKTTRKACPSIPLETTRELLA